MKVSEILSEMQWGQIYKGGPSTIDRSAPWVKAGMKKAAKIVTDIDSLDNAGEKFDYLYKLQSKTSKPRLTAKVGNTTHRLVVKDYNPESGEITVAINHDIFKTSAAGLTYDGRERSPSTPVKTYKFTVSNLEPQERPENPERPAKPKKMTQAEIRQQAAAEEKRQREIQARQEAERRRADQAELMRGLGYGDDDYHHGPVFR